MKTLAYAFVFLTALTPVAARAQDRTPFVKNDYAKLRAVPLATVPTGGITVDGDLSDWKDIPVKDGIIDDVFDHTVGSLSGDVRAAATFRFAHDDQALYVAVHVDDSSVIPSKSEIYNGDAVEVFLDFRPLVAPAGGHSLGESKYTDGCYQIMVAAPVAGEPLRQQLGTVGGAPLGAYDVAAKPVDGGYTVEIRIPFSSIAGGSVDRLKEPFGFDVSVDDIDSVSPVIGGRGDETNGSVSPRRSFAWSGNGDQWQDASAFGIADPSFNQTAPAPLLRTSPATYTKRGNIGLDGKGSVIVAGDIAGIDAVDTQTAFDVATNPVVNLGKASVERTDHPNLGITVRRAWWPASGIASGKYSLATTYAAGLKQTVRADITASSTAAKPGKPFPAGTRVANNQAAGVYTLPNGIHISPAGKHIPLPGDLPQSFVWLDKTHLAVNTGGFHDQGVDVIDTVANKIVQTLPVYQTWGGIAVDGNALLVPGGHANKKTDASSGATTFTHALHPYTWNGTSLAANTDIAIASAKIGSTDTDVFASGVAVGPSRIYVTNINADRVYLLDSATHEVVASEATGYRPGAVAVSPSGKTVAVANWGGSSVTLYDTTALKKIRTIDVGSHPVALCYSFGVRTAARGWDSYKALGRLFVACSGSNSVSVIENGRVVETIKTSLDPNDLVGSTPLALAVSPDGNRLYVANADNNDVCVVDTSISGKSRVIGFIPTGWYPSALTVSPDGRKLYVGVGKGLHFSNNAKGTYIPNLLNGAVSVIDLPDAAHLAAFTKQVTANNAPHSSPSRIGRGAEERGGVGPGKIKHVLYIIRENRTYDQVLGDEPRGNGDPMLTMFGKDITPNVHKLVKDFVLLDNVYCNGEVSESGHQWCDAAYATDFVERAWVNSYSGKSEPDADDRLSASPAGYLWDNCKRHGLSYYSYGEFSLFTSSPNSPPVYTGEGTLQGHCNPAYGKLAWEDRDTLRSKIFIDDLHKAEKTGNWPQFIVMSLPEDHTHGLGTSSYTPAACVASNDLAVGQIVEAVSHSRFWKDTAIFIIEDDAQDGQDHIDAHRTVGLVISPYVKHGGIDHTLYTTSSFVSTMEDILGLPPMTQFDKNATPMWAAFDGQPVLTAYGHVPPRIDLMAKNHSGPAAVESAKLDFSAPDRADPDKLNALLWHAMKPGIPMPPPVRSAVLMGR